jgi:hypothetical protein
MLGVEGRSGGIARQAEPGPAQIFLPLVEGDIPFAGLIVPSQFETQALRPPFVDVDPADFAAAARDAHDPPADSQHRGEGMLHDPGRLEQRRLLVGLSAQKEMHDFHQARLAGAVAGVPLRRAVDHVGQQHV